MTIKFCNKCKGILQIMDIKNEKHLVCLRCKLKRKFKDGEQITITEKIKQKETGKGAAEKNAEGHDFKCKECGNTNCKLIDLGMMIGDEDWVYLLQCTKCDYSERIGEWC